jgi:hypothetical protein
MSRQTRDPDTGVTVIPDGAHAGERLSDVRSRLSGYHFAKESLTRGELDILLLAEALLELIDAEDPRGYRH